MRGGVRQDASSMETLKQADYQSIKDECNYIFGMNAAEVCDFVILVGKRQTESIKRGLDNAAYPADKIFIADNIGEALTKAYGLNSHEQKKIILLENDLPDNY